MKLQTSYRLYVVLVHVFFAGLALFILDQSKTFFAIAEVVIVISLVVSLYFLKAFSSPIDLIDAGIQSLKDRDFNTKLVKVGQYEMDTLIDVYNQMIDVLRSERLNKVEQNYFLDKLVQASPSGIINLDLNHKIKTINPAALRILGRNRTDLVGKALGELNVKLGSELESLAIGDSSVINVEGSKKYRCQKDQFLHNGFHQTFVVIEDLTYELLNTEKNAYEKVIRMMSHEVNNSMGAINSILKSVLAYSVQLNTETKPEFKNVLNVAIDRNSGLIELMRNFSEVVKIPLPNKQPYDLNQLINTVFIFTEPLCEKNAIKIHLEIVEQSIPVMMDINQMEQVLINVVKNAIESIGQDGWVKIKVKNPAEIVVEDNGSGITDEVKTRLFTPFFSTKKDGQGIGLTMSREILINHGFDFDLDTNSEGTTEFSIKMH